MSTAAEHTGHAHGAKAFHPHILPLKVYFGVGAALFCLTGITVWIAEYHLGSAGNLIAAMLIATIKGSLVALFFMHLLYDNKFYMIIFLSSLLFLSIFIVFTLFDVDRRGDIYPYQMHPRPHPTIEGLVDAEKHAAPPAGEAPADEAAPAKEAPAADAAPAKDDTPAADAAPTEGPAKTSAE